MSDFVVNRMRNGDTGSIKMFANTLPDINEPVYKDHVNRLNMLHLAVGLDSEHRDSMVELLINLKANVNYPAISDNIAGVTPLHISAMWGYDLTTKLLLLNGADGSLRDQEDMSPVDYASIWDNYGCVSILLRYGQLNIQSGALEWSNVFDSSCTDATIATSFATTIKDRSEVFFPKNRITSEPYSNYPTTTNDLYDEPIIEESEGSLDTFREQPAIIREFSPNNSNIYPQSNDCGDNLNDKIHFSSHSSLKFPRGSQSPPLHPHQLLKSSQSPRSYLHSPFPHSRHSDSSFPSSQSYLPSSRLQFRSSHSLLTSSQSPVLSSQSRFKSQEINFQMSQTPLPMSQSSFRSSQSPLSSLIPFKTSQSPLSSPDLHLKSSNSYFKSPGHNAQISSSPSFDPHLRYSDPYLKSSQSSSRSSEFPGSYLRFSDPYLRSFDANSKYSPLPSSKFQDSNFRSSDSHFSSAKSDFRSSESNSKFSDYELKKFGSSGSHLRFLQPPMTVSQSSSRLSHSKVDSSASSRHHINSKSQYSSQSLSSKLASLNSDPSLWISSNLVDNNCSSSQPTKISAKETNLNGSLSQESVQLLYRVSPPASSRPISVLSDSSKESNGAVQQVSVADVGQHSRTSSQTSDAQAGYNLSQYVSRESLDARVEKMTCEKIRQHLQSLGYQAGPITEGTKRIYLKLLMSLERVDHIDNVLVVPRGVSSRSANLPLKSYSFELNQIITGRFDFLEALALEQEFNIVSQNDLTQGPRYYFNYLLMDPRISQNIPAQAIKYYRQTDGIDSSDESRSCTPYNFENNCRSRSRLSPVAQEQQQLIELQQQQTQATKKSFEKEDREKDKRVREKRVKLTKKFNPNLFAKFLQAVFYVGKGQKSRDLAHLYDALADRDSITKTKIKRIRDIWSDGYGVVSLHLFHNVSNREALTREALMIEAIGLENLTNIMPGSMQLRMDRWNDHKRKLLGSLFIFKAYSLLIDEGERQLKRDDLKRRK